MLGMIVTDRKEETPSEITHSSQHFYFTHYHS